MYKNMVGYISKRAILLHYKSSAHCFVYMYKIHAHKMYYTSHRINT